MSIAVRSWVLSMLFFFAPHLHALGLGEIQVYSNFGEPLNAKISLMVPEAESLSDIKVRLASPASYQSNELQYPYGSL